MNTRGYGSRGRSSIFVQAISSKSLLRSKEALANGDLEEQAPCSGQVFLSVRNGLCDAHLGEIAFGGVHLLYCQRDLHQACRCIRVFSES